MTEWNYPRRVFGGHVRNPHYLFIALLVAAPSFAIPVSFEKRETGRFMVRFAADSAEIRSDQVRIGGMTLRFEHASPDARMEGLGASAPSTYFQGARVERFTQFPKVAVRGLYPGIDVVWHGRGSDLEYDLELAAGVPEQRVLLAVEGARSLSIDGTGSLIAETAHGKIRQATPAVFQGSRRVEARYVLLGRNRVGIRLGKHDPSRPLTIDPVLAGVKEFGGSGRSLVSALAADPQGNIYVAGQSNSPDFPVTANGFQTRVIPPLLDLSNGGQTVRRLQIDAETQVLAIGGTSDGKILYAQGLNGMYLSIDGGTSWKRTGPLTPLNGPGVITRPMVNSISVDAITPSNVLVGTNAGLFFSSDAGATWGFHNSGLPVSGDGYPWINSVFFNPNDHLIAYAVTNQPSYVFKSVDAGNSWTQLNPSYPGEMPPSQFPPFPPYLAALAPNGNDLFVADGNGTLFKTTDAGATWQLLSTQVYQITALAVDPSNGSNIYAQDYAGIQKSSDGGVTFTTVYPYPPGSAINAFRPKGIAVDGTGALYMYSQDQIVVTTDNGATLKTLPALYGLQTVMAAGGRVFVGELVPLAPFVVKLDPSGSQILYSTFVAGSLTDNLTGLAVDAQGSVALTGWTFSPDFPQTIPSSAPAPASGKSNVFVTRLSADGTRLLYSTLLGGSKTTLSSGIAVDSSGSVYITGQTSASDFPVTAGVVQQGFPAAPCTRTQSNFFVFPNTGQHAFVSKLRPDGSGLAYSTFLSGACGSAGMGIAVDSAGQAVVTGSTTSPDFPVSQGAFQTTFPGSPNLPSPPNPLYAGFVTKLSPAADKIVASTLVGGSGFGNYVASVMLDAGGNAWVTGFTQGISSGATPGVYQPKFVDACPPSLGIGPSPPYTGTGDAFALKLDPAFTAPQILTYFGGSCNEFATRIALDTSGNIWLSGTSVSGDFPLVSPFQGDGIAVGFVSELSPDASKLLFSSFSPGPAMTISPNGSVFVGGTDGAAAAIQRIDPAKTPAVIVNRIAPVRSYPPMPPPLYTAGIAPGLLVEITGQGLGPASKATGQVDATGRLPFVLAGTIVFFGDIPAPIISVQDSSIICFAPFEITNPTEVTVSVNGKPSNAVRMGVTPTTPQILNVINQDGTPNSKDHPAKAGEVLTLYVSGLGQTVPLSVDGLVNTDPLPVPVVKVTAFLPGAAIQPAYAGAAPGLISGITQVNVQLPLSMKFTGLSSVSVNSASAPVYTIE